MSLKQFVAKDGQPILIECDDILIVKQETEYDTVYNTEKKHSIITFRNGLTVKVLNSATNVLDLLKEKDKPDEESYF